MVANDAKMVAKITKLAAILVIKNDANLTLPPRFRQVFIESPHYYKKNHINPQKDISFLSGTEKDFSFNGKEKANFDGKGCSPLLNLSCIDERIMSRTCWCMRSNIMHAYENIPPFRAVPAPPRYKAWPLICDVTTSREKSSIAYGASLNSYKKENKIRNSFQNKK
ncbi:hypothetical protein TNCV_1056134 [Trichonephila clavipes]|nr:hypothetical protein TNCV_1056134 [Trichonephila clavipes]